MKEEVEYNMLQNDYRKNMSNIILSYCEICNILGDEQNSFRRNRSCTDVRIISLAYLVLYATGSIIMIMVNQHLQLF